MVAGLRFYNPGDISYSPGGVASFWGGTFGAILPDGQHIASFPSWDAGYSAFQNVIANKIDQYGTIAGMAPTYASDSAQWAANVTRFSGISATQSLDYADQSQMSNLEYGIMRAEGFSDAQIQQIQNSPGVTPGLSGDYGTGDYGTGDINLSPFGGSATMPDFGSVPGEGQDWNLGLGPLSAGPADTGTGPALDIGPSPNGGYDTGPGVIASPGEATTPGSMPSFQDFQNQL